MPNKPTTRFPARKRLIAAAIASCFVSAPAWANPAGPQVVNGAASFNQAGNLLTVNNSNGAIINWNSFSIGASETTRFNQASASSSVLNRVIANDPSVLLGTLSSNGHVWLVNPAGILVGQGARIDVAGFVASTLNVANQDFLAGRLNFGATPNAGSVQNDGQITTPSGGSVYLVAPSVTNNGIIDAPNGEVILAAGQTVQLLDTSTPGVSVAITGATGNATNLGQIVSEAGQIGIAGVLVNNSGTLNASSVVKQGGRIFLKASQDAYVDGAGRIVATGTKGGSVEVLGKQVAVTDKASVDVSGQNGGGTVLIGGDAHGANPAVQNAQRTSVGPDTVVRADAKIAGGGGHVVVWADGSTQFSGSVSARGGNLSGNGGFVESSGKQALDVAGARIDTRAPNGKTGMWLLDPASDYTIDSGTASTIAANISTSDVTVEAYGDGSGTVGSVNFQTDLNLTSGSGNTFTALAGENINLGVYNIATSGHNVTLTANAPGYGGSGAGAITSSTGGGNITTYGGNIDLSGVSVTVGALNASGAAGIDASVPSAYGAYGGGVGSAGGTVTINANTTIATGSITTAGGDGGAGSAATGSSAVPYAPYAPGGNGGQGGAGGDVALSISSPSGSIGTGDIYASGGQGGGGGNTTGDYDYYLYLGYGSCYSGCAYRANPGGNGGNGGNGGQVAINVTSGSINGSFMSVGGGSGTIDTSGGAGGAVGVNTSSSYTAYPYSYAGAQSYVGGDITIAATAGDINFGSQPLLSFGSITTGGGSLQSSASNNINIGADVALPSSIDLGAGTVQFRAGSDIGFAAPYTINTSGLCIVLSANDDLTQPNATFYTASGTGAITGGGSIITGGGNLTLSGYGVAVGALTTSGSSANFQNGSVTVTTTNGNIATGSITTAAFNASYSAGSVLLQTDTGTIAVNGDISAYGANGDASYYGGSSGGNVDLVRTGVTPPSGTAVKVAGNIFTYGGNALANSGGDGGEGGYVNIASAQGYSSAYALIGDITVSGNIDAHGGGGAGFGSGNSWGGSGGWGGYVYLAGNGAVAVGPGSGAAINTSGGDAGNSDIGYYYGNSGGDGGAVTTYGSMIAVNGSINAHGGRGSDGGEGAGQGGPGGAAQIGADGSNVSIYDANDVEVTTSNLRVYGSIDTHGGAGGNGLADNGSYAPGYGSYGGQGGGVTLAATGGITVDSDILAYGGRGGDGGAAGTSGYSAGGGGYGSEGGQIDVYGGSISLGGIAAYGGDGGMGGPGTLSYQGGNGASGGNGNSVNISSNGDISVGGPIDTHGGVAGDGGAFGGSGGYNCNYVECYDGNGGSVTLDAGGAVNFHSIVATGGSGGNGMAGGGAFSGGSGGDGGSGGSVEITAGSISLVAGGSGTISTYGGNGGNGGDDSANAGAGGNGAYGGYIYLDVTSGPVTVGDIDAHGGFGGNAGVGASGYYGGDGGWGGTVEICADSITTGSIFTRGGDGGKGGGNDTYSNYNGFSDNSHYGAGIGGDGGGIDLEANNAVIVNGSIDASGGNAGSAGGGYSGGSGGYGGNAAIDDPSDYIDDVYISGASIAIGGGTGTITALGGRGGAGSVGYSGGDGGGGGYVSLSAVGAEASGALFTTGGAGGLGDAGNGIAGSDNNWEIDADTITLAASDFGFFSTGGIYATSAFEFDPINTSSLSITPTVFESLSGIPTVKFGNGTTTADLALSGAIDLNSNGNTTLSVVTSGTISTSTAASIATGDVTMIASGGITLGSGSVMSASGTGDALVLANGGNFVNNAGAGALSTPNGSWLVYSVNPALDTDGGLVNNFKQYGMSYSTAPYSGPGTGNGFIYSIAPTVTAVLSGTTSKVYDGTTNATLAASNYSVSGTIDGDTVVFNDPAAGTYADKNAGTGKNVSVSGISIASATNGAAAVYGYQLGSATANANIGTIAQAPLTISAVTDSRQYNGTTSTVGVPTVTAGTVYAGDSLTGLTQSFASRNVLGTNGSTLNLNTGYTLSDGNGGNNYSISYASAAGTIIPAPLTLAAVTDSKVYDGTTTSSGVVSITGLMTGDNLSGVSQSYASKNVLGANLSTLGVSAGYALSDGNSGGNYTVTTTTARGTITPAPLTLAAVTQSKVYDGTTVSTGVVGITGLMTGDSLSGLSQSYASKNVLGANLSTLGVGAGYTLSDGNSGGNYTVTTTTAPGTITQRPLSTWIGGTSGNWSVASNWDALPDLSNVAAVSIPSGTTVTYDAAAGTTNLTSLTAGGLSIAGGTLNIANSLTVNSSFSQTGGTLGAFGSGSSASITQATGNLTLPAITVAKLDLSAPAGAITQSGPLAALTLITQSQGATTLDNPNNQVAGRVDMNAGGPLSLWASGDLTLGAIDAGANAVVIKAGGAILQAPGTGSSTNIIAGSADLSSIFGGASGDLAISTNTQITGALAATVGAEADFGGIRIQNTGAQPTSVTLTDNALAGAGVSFLNTNDITSTSGITLKTVTGGDLALLSNGNIIWDGGSLATPSGSVLISADGSLGVTGALSSPVDLALSSTTSINVGGSVVTAGSGTASFTAPTVTLNGSVDSADDVGIIATTIDLGSGSSTGAAHDAILAASNITATNTTVSAGHDISAAVTGDLRLNGSGFTAGNDIYVKLLGASSTLYLNDAAGLPPSFLWAQAPSTIHLNYAAKAFGGMVVDGIAVDPLTFVSSSGGSGLFYGAAKAPASPGAGLDVVYGLAPGTTDIVAPTLVDAVMAAINSSTTSVTPPAGTLPPGEYGNGLGAQGDLGDQTVGGTEGQFGGDEEEENKTDKATGLKKKPNKSITKKLSTCS